MESTNSAILGLQSGMTSDEARRRLEKFRPNAMPDTALHPGYGIPRAVAPDGCVEREPRIQRGRCSFV
jgi:hypothetical protein